MTHTSFRASCVFVLLIAKKKSETQWDRIKTGLNEDKKRLQENKRKVENEKLDLEEIVDRLNAEIRKL